MNSKPFVRSKMSIKHILKNKIVSNAGWLIAGNVIHGIITFLVGALTARYLGPDNYGLINYASAYTTFFFSICTLGLNSVMLKGMIDHPEKEGTLLGSALMMRGISSLLSALMIIGIVSIVDRDEPLTIAVVALCSLGMVFRIADSMNIWFQAHLISKFTAIASTIAYIVTSAYKLALLMLGKDVRWFALASSVDYIVVAIVLFISYRKMRGPKLAFSLETAKGMLGKSYHYILSGMMVAVYGSTDKLMLKQILGETETGYYATAVALCGVWCFILRAIIDSVHPSIIEAAKENDEKLFRKRNIQLYAVVFYISVFVSFFFAVLADDMIYILYGKEYLPAASPLRIITWYTAFSYLGAARSAWVVTKERQKHLFCIYAVSALANVILNLLLIPVMGASGAAIASLVAQVFTTLVVPFFIKDMKENSMMMLDAIMLKDVL